MKTYTICVVSYKDTNAQYLVDERSIRDGKIQISVLQDYDEYENPICRKEWMEVEVDCTYLVHITAHFMMQRDQIHAVYAPGGGLSVNHLAYFYSVVIVEKTDRFYVGITPVTHAEAGVRATRFNMYSYHNNEPSFHYQEEQLVDEVYKSLRLPALILGEEDKT